MPGALELIDDLHGNRARLWTVISIGRGDDDHQRNIATSEFIGEHLSRPGGLRGWVLKPTRRKVLRYRDSKDSDRHHQQYRYADDPAWRSDGESGDAVQHSVSLSRHAAEGRGPGPAAGDLRCPCPLVAFTVTCLLRPLEVPEVSEPMIVSPELLIDAGAQSDAYSQDLFASHSCADAAIDSAAHGWVGRSATALSLTAIRWAVTTTELSTRIWEHGDALRLSGVNFAATERRNTDALAGVHRPGDAS